MNLDFQDYPAGCLVSFLALMDLEVMVIGGHLLLNLSIQLEKIGPFFSMKFTHLWVQIIVEEATPFAASKT